MKEMMEGGYNIICMQDYWHYETQLIITMSRIQSLSFYNAMEERLIKVWLCLGIDQEATRIEEVPKLLLNRSNLLLGSLLVAFALMQICIRP